MVGLWEVKRKSKYKLGPASAAFPQGRAAFFCPTFFGRVLRQSGRLGHFETKCPEVRGGSPGCRSPPILHFRSAQTQKSKMEDVKMTTINLREFFYWYLTDEYIEVSEEVAAVLRSDSRYEERHYERRSIPWTLGTALKTTFASLNRPPRSSWIARSSLCSCAMSLIPCLISRAGGSTRISFLGNPSGRLPTRRA